MAYTLPKSRRLLRAGQFERVFAAKQSRADGRLVVYTAANDLGHPRLGLVVSRKVGGAVVRNRWKRLLREAFRLAQHELPTVDLVCIPRGKEPPELEALIGSLLKLTQPRGR